MKIDYHTHNIACEHAIGEIEEYVQQAITLGLWEIGISDHAPMPEPQRQGITMRENETEDYIKEVLNLQKKYAEQIKIKLAFEIDFPLFHTFNKEYFQDSRFDYFIGSCHFLDDWAFDNPDEIEKFNNQNIDILYKNYFKIIEQSIESRYFDIIGHIDLIKKFGHRPTKDITLLISHLAKKLNLYDQAVELNTAGLRKPVKEIYPAPSILKIFYENNVPLTLGSDAHSPQEVGADFNYATEILEKIGYKKICGFNKHKRYTIDL